MKIPLADLRAQYATIREAVDAAIRDVVASTQFVGGEFVQRFESQWAEYCRARHAIGVGNGTDAIYLALRALGVGPGHEVVTVPNTFIATAEAITMAGAKVRFVDVDPETQTMDPNRLEEALTPATRAIVPVHLWGQMAEMGPIADIAKAHRIQIVEDAAQAHGAEFHGKRPGAFGAAATFSFFPGKNLGAYGDAGAIVCDQPELADRIARLRDHGRQDKYVHREEGVNSRLDGIQAAVLSAKLPHLERWTERRRQIAGLYRTLLAGLDERVRCVPERPGSRHVYHQFVVRLGERDRVKERLSEAGVSTGIHYPVPLHLQPAYRYLGLDKGSFPEAEKAAEEILSLPIYPEMTDEAVGQVAKALRGALS